MFKHKRSTYDKKKIENTKIYKYKEKIEDIKAWSNWYATNDEKWNFMTIYNVTINWEVYFIKVINDIITKPEKK